jgi:hypothetical protein
MGHVMELWNLEAQKNNLLIPVAEATERAGKRCTVFLCTIKKITKDSTVHCNEVLSIAGQKKKRLENHNAFNTLWQDNQ